MSGGKTLAALREKFVTRPFAVFAPGSVMQNAAIDPARVRELTKVQSLALLGRRQIRELDHLELLDPVLAARTTRQALESDCRLWILSTTDDAEPDQLRKRFGGALADVSIPDSDGEAVYAVQPGLFAQQLLHEHPELATEFAGVATSAVPREVLPILEAQGVPTEHRSAFSRLLRDPRFYAYIVVFVYSALRALPVTFVEEFQGSLLVLWSIDLITALPYTWGVLAMLTGRTYVARLLGATVTLVTFVAPYVYFWMHGQNYPPIVFIVVATLVLITISSEWMRFRKERRLERRYASSTAVRVPAKA